MKKNVFFLQQCLCIIIAATLFTACSKEKLNVNNQAKANNPISFTSKFTNPVDRVPGPTGAKIDFSYTKGKPTSLGTITVSFEDETKLSLDCTDVWDITGWKWNFGDGATSTLANPIHDYTSLGRTYKVTLEITFTSSTDGHTVNLSFSKNITL